VDAQPARSLARRHSVCKDSGSGDRQNALASDARGLVILQVFSR
jgi:hypothetical protein